MAARPEVRRWLLRAALVALVLGLGEAVSAAFFHAVRERFPFREPSRYTLSAERIASLAGHFDPELGWRSRYPTPFGERPRSVSRGDPWLAVFGDSFVHGDEVADDETWAEGVAARSGRAVLNLGVGGYGPDQALLLYRRHAGRLPVTVVALGFTSENVNRVVNRYRPFYIRATGVPYPKPRFEVREGQLALVPQPLRTAADLNRLADAGTIEELGRGDAHYQTTFPALRFPYLRLAFHPEVWRHATATRRRGEAGGGRLRHWRGEGGGIILAIIDAFVAEATQRGHIAAVVMLGGINDVRAARAGRDVSGRSAVIEHCAARGYRCFDGIAALANTAVEVKALFQPGGHPSPHANQVLGEALHAWLLAQLPTVAAAVR